MDAVRLAERDHLFNPFFQRFVLDVARSFHARAFNKGLTSGLARSWMARKLSGHEQGVRGRQHSEVSSVE
jgi:hypothetical protein